MRRTGRGFAFIAGERAPARFGPRTPAAAEARRTHRRKKGGVADLLPTYGIGSGIADL